MASEAYDNDNASEAAMTASKATGRTSEAAGRTSETGGKDWTQTGLGASYFLSKAPFSAAVFDTKGRRPKAALFYREQPIKAALLCREQPIKVMLSCAKSQRCHRAQRE